MSELEMKYSAVLGSAKSRRAIVRREHSMGGSQHAEANRSGSLLCKNVR